MAITLYEDEQLKIITEKLFYHTFCIKSIKKSSGKCLCYDIPKRTFNETFKLQRGQLESKLDEINPKIKGSLKKANINIDSAHLAMCLAAYQFWEIVRADRDSERMSFMR